ncbi:hypothetical protein B2A_12684 [mine drainage metagenome]|uniref:Uncharacterized protein n=1 Tax=mine drainage metagenome TaxID=410659 RepID=T0YH06_9ZZZZ
MSKKLKLNPNVSYILGACSHTINEYIGIRSRYEKVVEKFVKLSMDEFGIEPNKVLISEEHGVSDVKFYNSKLKRLLADALERKTRLFKYRNDYSAEYVAGLFDVYGGINQKGPYLISMDSGDLLILENIGIHTMQQGSKSYIINPSAFMGFIANHSVLVSKERYAKSVADAR